MARKRKRDSHGADAPGKLKRVKPAATPPPPDPESQADRHPSPSRHSNESAAEPSEPLWVVRNIVDENARQYLIDWEDDSDGQSFEPTWEPKENANEAAVRDWEEKKKRVERRSGQGVKPKRGRGRPSKASLAASESGRDDEAREDEQEPEPDEVHQSASKPKRGRGRPRKSHPPPSSEATSAVHGDEDEEEGGEQPPAVKRGRGRPRKSPLVKPPQPSGSKKGRGRPRKHPIAETETSEHSSDEGQPENDLDRSKPDAEDERPDRNASVGHLVQGVALHAVEDQASAVDVQGPAADSGPGRASHKGEKSRKRSIGEVSSEADTQPIRRKRGRPRIHPAVPPSPEDDQLVVRSPGRPRNDDTVTPRGTPDQTPTNATPSAAAGRTSIGLSSVSAPEEEDVDDKEDREGDEPAPVARRGRGRPRKHVAAAAVAVAVTPLTSSRGRGRPRKHPVAENSLHTDPPKRERPRNDTLESAGPARLQVTMALEAEESSDDELVAADKEFPLEKRPAIPARPLASHDDEDHDMTSDFHSSQVLKGTQPEPSHSEPHLVDAAAAESLSQKHSEYEPSNASLSSLTNKGTGQTTSINSSSGVHTLPVTRRFGSGVIIPDSQSFLDSSSCYISEHAVVESTEAPTCNPVGTSTESQLDICQQFADIQSIPESSVAQKPSEPPADDARDVSTLDEPSTQSVVQVTIEDKQIPPDASSPAGPRAEEGTPRSRSPASPIVARSSSSYSSPPPTESPDKSQSRSETQFQSQSHPQSQSQSTNLEPATQPAQRREIFCAGSPGSVTSRQPADEQPAPRPESLQDTSEPSHFVTQVSSSALKLQRREVGDEPDNSPPVGSQSYVRTSSSLPSIPIQDPPTIGESAPTPIRSLSEPVMASTPSSTGKSLRDKLSEMRAASKAKAADALAAALASPKPASAVPARLMSPSMHDREVRSPSQMSSIPPNEIIPEEAPEEMNRSERYETLLPEQGPQVRSNGVLEFDSDLPDADPSTNQHLVPLDFGVRQHEHYKNILTYNQELIDEFTDSVYPADSDLAMQARALIEKLESVVTHPDLVDSGTISQGDVDPTQLADWDQNVSVKFKFLRYLLESAKTYNLHLALLLAPGRLAGMLQTFLQGCKVLYNVIDGKDNAITEEATATILLTSVETGISIPPLDLIVVMEGNMPTGTITRTQKMLSHGDVLVPAVITVIPKSVEHVRRCIPLDMPEAERLNVIISTVTSLRYAAGNESGGLESLEGKASEVVSWILNPSDWPFYGLPDIQLLDPITSTQGSENDHDERDGLKRPLGDDLDDGIPTAKKARIDEGLPLTINPHDMHFSNSHSHVSDSVAASQHATALQILKEEHARKEREHQEALRIAQTYAQDHVKALETLQYDREEQRQKLVAAEAARDQAFAREKVLEARLLDLNTKNSALLDERRELRAKVDTANSALLDHAIPEQAEFQSIRLDAEAARLETAKQSAKAKSLEDQLDYLRDQYQTASNQASTLARDNEALRKSLAAMTTKATGEQARLRTMSMSTYTGQLAAEKRKLQAQLAEQGASMARLNEEIGRLREASRGRVSTRASSVPRTPSRLGSPKLDRAPGSRQGSPASARVPHPLRKG